MLEPTYSIPVFHASPSPEHRSPYLRPTDALKNPVSGTPLLRQEPRGQLADRLYAEVTRHRSALFAKFSKPKFLKFLADSCELADRG